jgi:putative FmdB family regulatory protein
MPLYEFRCDTCSHTFEELVRSGGVPSCPVCGNASPARLLSTFAARAEAAGPQCGAGECCGGGACAPAVPRGGGCGCGRGGCGH